ncbi:MAG: small multi-drug export protein [Candidatus Tagabacteria bacterium]
MEKEILTILTGALPISEVRGAIPLAIAVFHFSLLKAYFLSVIGNLLIIVPALFFLHKLSDFLMRRVYFINRFLTWLFERTQRLHQDHFHHYSWAPLALFIFVAIPLPFTGAWSGAVAAFIFGIPFWRSVLSISLGVLAAGVIVLSIMSLGWLAFNSVL